MKRQDSPLGAALYRIVEPIRMIVNTELWIRRWTRGHTTQQLIQTYLVQLRRTPLLRWDPITKTCAFRVGLSLFDVACNRDTRQKSSVLVLTIDGRWTPYRYCHQCMLHFV